MANRQFNCAHCGAVGERENGQLNRLEKAGHKPFCSRECSYKAKATGRVAQGWHERRFVQRDTATHTNCRECGIDMWLPQSKLDEYKRCSPACNEAWRERTKKVAVIHGEKVKLDRPCETCGIIFRPRPNQVRRGCGRYCSQKCNKAFHNAGQDKEVWQRRIVTIREKRARGEWTLAIGERNANWKGGREAMKQRMKESGIQRKWQQDYRKRNPHKVREFATRRKGRKLGRLEYGTIPKLLKLQKLRCAICRTSINSGRYHVDHIIPLALGGEHKAANVQLLCPPCNLHKSDRDPIIHMQSLGRLL